MKANRALIVTRAELAQLLAVRPDRVTKYVAEGMPVLATGGGRGKQTTFDLAAVLPWLLQRRTGTLDAARERFFRLQADRIEQDLRRRAGELVEARDVERRWAGMVTAARERLLALPAVVLQRGLVAATGEDDLIALVDEALTELAGRGADAQRA